MLRAALMIGGALTLISAATMWVTSRVEGAWPGMPLAGCLLAAPVAVALAVGVLAARARAWFTDGELRLRTWRGELRFRPVRALNWRRVTNRGQVVGQTLVLCAPDGRVAMFTDPFWEPAWGRQVAAACAVGVEELGSLTVGRLSSALPAQRWPFWIRHPRLTPVLSLLLVAGYLGVVIGVSVRA
jgi:hypothetical protein